MATLHSKQSSPYWCPNFLEDCGADLGFYVFAGMKLKEGGKEERRRRRRNLKDSKTGVDLGRPRKRSDVAGEK